MVLVMYTLSLKSNKKLMLEFSKIKESPYVNYIDFYKKITEISNRLYEIHPLLFDILSEIKLRKNSGELVFFISNCLIDEDIPIYDKNFPVEDKYLKKKTFIAESFLQLVSYFIDTPLLGYETRNNGDFFHDVYEQRLYSKTQTQKSGNDLFCHNDRTAHDIRADLLFLLGMRTQEKNISQTFYIDGKSIIDKLSSFDISILKKHYYFTPFDEYSKDSNSNQNLSKRHSVICNNDSLRYYETRTRPIDSAPKEAWIAMFNLFSAISKSKKRKFIIENKDLLIIPNQKGLHGRYNVSEQGCGNRYLLKTYNFLSKKQSIIYDEYLLTEYSYLIRES